MNFAGLAGTVLIVLEIAVFVMTVYAFIHAAMQRGDAYTARDLPRVPGNLTEAINARKG